MALYETVFIARQDITSTQADALAETYQTILKDNGGSVSKTENWGLKTLAFRMNKNRKGHYILMNIDAPSAAVAEMERNMRLSEDVLRYLTIRVDEHETGPSMMMQNRGERGDRGMRSGRPRRDEREEGVETTAVEGVPA